MSAEEITEKGYGQALVGGSIGGLFGLLIGGFVGLLVGLVLGAAITVVVTRLLVAGGGKAAGMVYTPRGDTTAYTPTLSHIETLEVRGDFERAAEAWDEQCAADPTNARLLMRAADFHLRYRKDHVAAYERYLKARETGTGSVDLRRYVSQKIIDLNLGPLANEGRAMVELARFVQDFAGTPEASAAKETLAALKARRAQDA